MEKEKLEKMHLRANIYYILEGRTEEYRGLIHKHCAIGREARMDFDQFIAALVGTACETAVAMGLVQTTEELQAELGMAFTWCRGLTVEDIQDD